MNTPPFVALYCRTCGVLLIGGPIEYEHVAEFARTHKDHNPRLLNAEDTKRVIDERKPKRATTGKDAPCLAK